MSLLRCRFRHDDRNRLAGGLLLSSVLVLGSDVLADTTAGESVFRQCAGCHEVGSGAKNRFGPPLNGVVGGAVGGVSGYEYSAAFGDQVDGGLTWEYASLNEFLTSPMAMIPGTKMAFPGLSSETDRRDVIDYLAGYDRQGIQASSNQPGQVDAKPASIAKEEKNIPLARDTKVPVHGILHLGRIALDEEISAWDIDVRPDGKGLPSGRGTVEAGGEIYDVQCASCHGVFGEGEGRWPILAGGYDTLAEERPEKTIGSYWPYLSTVFDYVKRAMPFGNARSLSDEDVYALTAYLLYLNDLVDESFVLTSENFSTITLPNAGNFIEDTRSDEAWYGSSDEPCMTNCIQGQAVVSQRARILDVTPDSDEEGSSGGVD